MLTVNRRTTIRFKTKDFFKVLIRHNGKYYAGSLVDITLGGIGVILNDLFTIKINDIIDFSFMGVRGMIKLAEVKRVSEKKLGIRFEVNEENNRIVTEFLNTNMKSLKV